MRGRQCDSKPRLACRYHKSYNKGTLRTWSQPGPSPSRGGQLFAMATSQAQLICFRALTTNTHSPQPAGLCLPASHGWWGEQEGAEVIEMLF